MSRSDDDLDMTSLRDDLLLSGAAVPEEPELTAFVAGLRSFVEVEPQPTAALQTLLREGLSTGAADAGIAATAATAGALPGARSHVVRQRRRRSALRAFGRLGLAAKLALGAGVAAASVAAAATVDAVPDAIQEPAAAVVSGVVELLVPEHGDSPAPGVSESPDPARTAPGVGPGPTDDPAHPGRRAGGPTARPEVPGQPAQPQPGGPANPDPGGPADPQPGGPADPNPGGPADPDPGGPADPQPGGPADPAPGTSADPDVPVNPQPRGRSETLPSGPADAPVVPDPATRP